MGKSKRIRADRARQVVDSPEKFQKDDATRKAKITSVILISVIAGLIALTIALVALSSSGIKARSTIIAYTDDFQFTGTMATYVYYNQYNIYYQYLGSSASQYVTPSLVVESIKETLAICQAAKDNGVELGEIENRKIDAAVENIKKSAREAGISISNMYGGIGINASDIENVLRLQYLATKYETKYTNDLMVELGSDASKVEEYFNEHKSQLLKGDYVSINTTNEAWIEEIKSASEADDEFTADEFKELFIKLYGEANFKEVFNDANGTPAKAVAEKLVEAVADWLIYKNLEIKPEGVEINDEMTVKNIIKACYEADPATEITGMGITKPTEAIYETYAKLAEAADTAIVKADYDAETDKETFLKNWATSKFKTYVDEAAALPTEAVVEGFMNTVIELVGFVGYDLELEQTDASLTGTETKITKAMVKVIYEKVNSAASDEVYTMIATAAGKLLDKTKTVLKVVTDHTYPTVSEQEAEDSTTAETTTSSETTAAGTTAGTTTAGETTTANTAPADFDDLSIFNQKFFTDANENDIIYDGDMIYFVVTPGKQDKTPTKNVGHILVKVDTETAANTSDEAEVSRVEEANKQAFADAMPKAEEILAEFLAGAKTKDSFEALANKYTDDSGVFYYNVKKGQMVEEFEDWIYDDARQAGDTGIVKTDYGYHVMYFIGDGYEAWKTDTVSSMTSEKVTEWLTELEKAVNADVDLFTELLS